jgi:hypothetical protein
MAAKMTLPGTYVFRFSGFDRKDDHGRHVAGVGTLTMDNALTITGKQRATNNPMWGGGNKQTQGDYNLTGKVTITEAGPPIVGEAAITFSRTGGAGRDMTDVFTVVQSSPSSLWLVSLKPEDTGKKPIEEMVVADLIQVDTKTW